LLCRPAFLRDHAARAFLNEQDNKDQHQYLGEYRPGDGLEVVGSGGITLIDPSDLTYSSMDRARRSEPVSLIGIRLHILVAGGRFESATREAFAS